MVKLIREGNEIQDSEILAGTRIEHGTGGMMRLVYPDDNGGELLTSEWFEGSKRSKAVIPWMASVRNVLLAKFQEVEDERRRKTEDLRRTLATQPPKIEIPEGALADPPPSPTDPVEFARHHYRAAYSRYFWLARELEASKPELQKWTTVLTALGVSISEEDAAAAPGSDDAAAGGNGAGAETPDGIPGSPDRVREREAASGADSRANGELG